MDAEKEANRLLKMALDNIKDEDYTHRGFLKPIQIALKTYQTQRMSEADDADKTLQAGSLPAGLKIAVRGNGEKRVLKNIEPIEEDEGFEEIKMKNQNNILTLMKKRKPSKQQEGQVGTDQCLEQKSETGGIKLAICVCMYSETKPMLKSTLAGIADNIANMVAYEGIDPDDIGVFVMMDGIEKVDDSIISYFEELEKCNNINLGENIASSLTIAELAERSQTMTPEEINDEEMKNVNNYLFNAAELEERNSLRFDSIRLDYFEKKELLDTINKLKNSRKKPHYDDLNRQLQLFFLEEAKKHRKKDYGLTDDQVNELKSEVIIEDYISDLRRARPMIATALQKASEYCKSYLTNKDDLAYLSCFRNKIPFSKQVIEEIEENIRESGEESTNMLRQFSTSKQYDDDEIDGKLKPTTIMNLFLCVKFKNSGKLSSHNWFFNGFCKELRPEYAVLLDVGLRPEASALMNMYKYMKEYENIGGVCGYMSLKMEKIDQSEEIKEEQVDCMTNISLHLVDIQRTQQVEYHFAHLMDKPFEASFGFIHVLPGAFSAYNMEAILSYEEKEDDELLKSYFKSIDEKLANQKIMKTSMGLGNALLRTALPDFINSCCINVDPQSDQAMLYNENVYLAEDRILCMGIHKKGFDMAFLPDAYAEVDPVKTVHGLLGQRKRWINGSYFAFEKVKRELSDHQKSNGCEIGLNLQIFYLSLMNALSYFSPSFFLFTVHIAMEAFRADVLQKYFSSTVSSNVLDFFVLTMDFIYVMMIGGIIFYSIHFKNGNKYFKPFIYTVSTVFGIFMIIIMAVLLVDIIRGLIGNTTHLITNAGQSSNAIDINLINLLRWMLIGSLGLYFIPLIAYWVLFWKIQPMCEVMMGYLSFIFYSPTYLNVLNIYSLCRIDDISWGTKGLDTESGKNANLKDSWKMVKFVHISKYVIWNILLAATLLTLGASYVPRFWVTFGMVCLIGSSVGIKVLVGILYMIYYKCKRPARGKNPTIESKSRIRRMMLSYRKDIQNDIMNHLKEVKSEYMGLNYIFSFIQAGRTKKVTQNDVRKQKNDQTNMLSEILGIFGKSSMKPQRNMREKEKVADEVPLKVKSREKEENKKDFVFINSNSQESSNLELIRKSRANDESSKLEQQPSMGIESIFGFPASQNEWTKKEEKVDKDQFRKK